MVVLVNSPLFRKPNGVGDEDSLPPIGLGLIATHLKNNNLDVKLIDALFNKTPLDELIQILNQWTPEFLGINIFTTNYELVKELIESIDFSTHIIIGGLSTKELYRKIIGWSTPNQIDVVIGDGELITLDIVVGKVKEDPILKKQNRRIFNVDACSRYFLTDISDVPLMRSFLMNEPMQNQHGLLEANIITGRGCVHNCTFCAAARSMNLDLPIREKSIDSIIKELSEIHFEFPKVRSIRILDDLFLKSKSSITKAVTIFSNFDYQWRSMAHIMTFNQAEKNDIIALKKCGCSELFIGLESGSSRILKAVKKTYDKKHIIKTLTKIFEGGINVKGYFIFGFPDETWHEMKSTFDFAYRIKQIANENRVNFRTSVFQFRPYHGSEIYKKLNLSFDDDSIQIEPDQVLTNKIGRGQFNFHSGNFSNVCLRTIHKYICMTNDLNGSRSYTAGNQGFHRPVKGQKV